MSETGETKPKRVRRREPAVDRAMLLVAQAIKEGWDCPRLAREAGVGTHVASNVLAKMSEKIVHQADRQLGVYATQMREAVQANIPKVVKLCERTLCSCEQILDRLESDIEQFDVIQTKHGEAPASIPLAGAAKTLAGAMASLGQTIKELTGMGLAERVAEAKAKADAKSGGKIRPWEVDIVEVDVLSE